jgi:predicted dehydrogenase
VITISILGGGFMGSAHAANYRRLRDRVRVKTIAARTPARAAKVAESVGAELTSDLDAAVRDPDVDAVDVCLPTPLHRDAVERAFEAGKDVFLEKPIALTLDDADAIVRAAERRGRLLMVGHVLRFWPEYVELQRRLAAGELGQPLAISTSRLSPPADWNDWMADRRKSGGTSVDLLIHDFDQMNWLLGRARSVLAREPLEGHIVAMVEYDGAIGNAEGSMRMPSSYPFSSGIRVLAEAGVAEYAFSAAPAEDGGNIGNATAATGLRLYPSGAKPLALPAASTDPWGPELEYFVECVEQRRDPEQGTGDQAREALLVALAANESIKSGRPQRL